MKKTMMLFTSLAATLAFQAAGCAEIPGGKDISAVPVAEMELGRGRVRVYSCGTSQLHAFLTGDPLDDVAYIVESKTGLAGIELPPFAEDLEVWKQYAESLKKPLEGLFICCHPAGGSYVKGVKIYGTQSAKNSIASGPVYGVTQGLYQAFGPSFLGADMVQIDSVVSGTVQVAGIGFELIDRGGEYDLVIPSLNAVYTHMLGKTTHSIMTSPAQIRERLAALREYQKAGYGMILTSHGGLEGQDAVSEKIFYLEKAGELAAASAKRAEFLEAMKGAFPRYTGENYLDMSAAALFPSEK